jgi:transcriptional regulator with PAS, ATPase and Fis domain
MIEEGTFRADLHYRLQVVEVRLPPLRERQEDIPLLAHYFMTRMATHLNRKIDGLSAAAEAALVAYDWPGNVRELQHAIQRALA